LRIGKTVTTFSVKTTALILEKIVRDANAASKSPEPVKKVVITCPAYFGTKERMRTEQAGKIAGLEVLAILNEPTAAAIAYGINLKEPKVILVYDLGGGTFDVTLIKIDNGVFTVIATDGDHHLGGVDWDTLLAEYMLKKYNEEQKTSYKFENRPNLLLKNKFLLLAEEQKIRLTNLESFSVNLEIEGKTSRIELTRELFDSLTASKLETTIDMIIEVIKEGKKQGYTKIDEVLLVGGSSKMPQVKARVDRELKCDAKIEEPDECVAKGAAIVALNYSYYKGVDEYIGGERDEKPKEINQDTRVRFTDATSKNYGEGFETATGKKMVRNIIFANTSIDKCHGEEPFQTKGDTDSIWCEVYESDIKDKEYEPGDTIKPLDKRLMQFTQKYIAGTPIKTVYDIDTNGILHIHNEVGADSYDYELQIKGLMSDKEIEASKARMDAIIKQ
jgi:molecular chaperone DnaK (HSP70)